MDLGPQVNHARFRVYYRSGTWEARRLVSRRQISCRWRCRCVLVQIIMYFNMKINVNIPFFRAPSFFKCWVRLWKGPKDKNQALKWQLLWWEGVFQHGPPAQPWLRWGLSRRRPLVRYGEHQQCRTLWMSWKVFPNNVTNPSCWSSSDYDKEDKT